MADIDAGGDAPVSSDFQITNGEKAVSKALAVGLFVVSGVSAAYVIKTFTGAAAAGSISFHAMSVMTAAGFAMRLTEKVGRYFWDVSKGIHPDIAGGFDNEGNPILPAVTKLEETSARIEGEIARIDGRVDNLEQKLEITKPAQDTPRI